jgi:type II secretory pathway component PulF
MASKFLQKIKDFDLKKAMLKFNFGLSRRIGLYEKIRAFLEANIDLMATLRAIRDRYAERKDSRAAILSEWMRALDRGSSFADAIASWIPSSELMLIESGERGGDIASGLREAGVLSSASARNKSAILGSVAYPVVLFLMLMGMLIMFHLQMAPIFEQIMPKAKWPGSAKSLDEISSFVYEKMWLVGIVGVVLSIWIGKTMGTWTRNPRPIFDKFPPWNIYRSYQASSFLIGLSSLLRAGVPEYDALVAMSKNASPWMKAHLNKMMLTMSLGGANMGRALDTGMLDIETAGDVQDYSRLASFSEAIYLIGGRALEDGIKKIQARMGAIKYLLLFTVALSVVWIYFAAFALETSVADAVSPK